MIFKVQAAALLDPKQCNSRGLFEYAHPMKPKKMEAGA